MALLAVKHRKAIFQYLGLGEYNKKSIKAFQKAYMFREKDWDGIYGQDTDNTLRTVYYTIRYTKNFSPKEFRCECGGKYCCGYPSFMKPAQLIHIQAIRDKYGKPITITSGLRCKKWNSALGGSIQNSLHMSGQALDFYQEGVTDTLKNRKATAKWIRKQENHHYTYGNGIYWLTTDDGASTGSVSAPYMGNALHTDTYNNVKPTYPKYTETPKVIDISNFQDTIDFAKVKADGIDGVIAKCGYRGAETGKLADDSRFLEHIKGAYKAGLAVGIYMFTQAITKAEAKAEADYAVSRWKKAGVPVSFPIAIDTENVFYEKDGKRVAGRANGLSKAKRTAVVKAFCERIVELGYEPMIYASTSWLDSKLDMSQLPYKVWVAQYADKCEYDGKYILWQYTSEGNVDGVKGNVDMNYCYTELKEVPCPKAPVWLAKANKWCRKIAKDNTFIYVRFNNKKPNTKKCCICHPEVQDDPTTKGFNCIKAAFAAWKHGAGLDINDQDPIDNAGWDKLLAFKTDEEANKYASKRIGQPVKVIRNGGKAIPLSKLEGGEVCGLYNGDTIQHIIFYMGGETYFESNTTGGIGDAKNIRADLPMSKTVKSKLKVAIRYEG